MNKLAGICSGAEGNSPAGVTGVKRTPEVLYDWESYKTLIQIKRKQGG